MNKQDFFKLLAVIAVLGFVAEMFYIGGPSIILGGSSGGNQSGTSVFSGTVRTYDPLLVIPLNTSTSVLDQLRARDDVKNVRTDTQGYVIDADTRDDIYTIGAFLKSVNVSSLTVANVAVTEDITVDTVSGPVKAKVPGGVIRVVMEPMVETGSEVTVSMAAVVRSGVLVDYGSASLAVSQVSLLMDAYVESAGDKTYTFTIPWEERNKVDLSNLTDYEYKKVDSVVFRQPLSVGQITEKRKLFYVTYIDDSSAQVSSDFDDLTQLTVNFQDANFTLPPSKLVVVAQSLPGVPYNYTAENAYGIRINDSRVGPSLSLLNVVTPKEFAVNETLKLNVTALVMGNHTISIVRAALPS
ncbi:MAG TPA: hypothetical protein VLD37_04310 [Candidatus Bilamarchaeum sp.]|nr:hypothetical protein [Candidatus Bilamarchaeum sp.]